MYHLDQIVVCRAKVVASCELTDRVIITPWHKEAAASQEIQDGVRCDGLRLNFSVE